MTGSFLAAQAGTRERLLLWRWCTVGATLLVVALKSPTWAWAVVLGLPLFTAGLVLQYFSKVSLDRWLDRGYLIMADVNMVGLALLGAELPALPFLGFFAVVMLNTLVSSRRRALPGSIALLLLLAATASSGAISGIGLDVGDVLYLPLLLAATMHFGNLGQELSARRTVVETARHDTTELWALLEISETIGGAHDVGDVMRSIVHRVGELVETDSCSILLTEDVSKTCFVVASMGHPEVDMLELNLEDYPEIRHAITTGEPVMIDDVAKSPLLASVRSILLSRGYRSMLVLPLIFKDEVLGTLVLRSRRDQPFTPAELSFCKVVAGASASALKNALLYREVIEESARHRETSEKLRRLVDCTPDLIVATDGDGRIVEFSVGTEKLTGLTADHAEGQLLSDVLGADFEPQPPVGAGTASQDVRFVRADGARVEISLVSAPLFSAEGESGRVWIGRDVTKLRRVEKRLVQAERLSSLGEIVAGVAHELNNPLSGVVGYAELLRMKSADPDQIRDLDRIVESSLRCQKIVFNLLSFARKHPPEKKQQNFNRCVEKVLDLKAYHLRASQIETIVELDPDLPETCFDFHQLEQVILNLLNNAEHAVASTKEPGKVILRTGFAENQIYLEVEDDGPGVPDAVRDRIFNPFFTTKDIGDGTGLGLSVSYGLVEEHGGTIELIQEPQAGTCFRVSLPVVCGAAPTEAEPSSGAEGRGNPLAGCRVLVAEDEPVVLELFSRLLGEEGAHVTLAADGQEAWEKLSEQDFDLIVADLRMPNLSGQQLYELAAAERPELIHRFVFATGDLVRDDSVAFLEGVPHPILRKPLELETVRRVLARAIESVAVPR